MMVSRVPAVCRCVFVYAQRRVCPLPKTRNREYSNRRCEHTHLLRKFLAGSSAPCHGWIHCKTSFSRRHSELTGKYFTIKPG